ncbi:GNAT family N-acetyltransferase [Sphingomonas sp. PP-CE-1G-424]|uniref:GNAT family N-acetyltransferase n=1 Tax=Sphingomonas sp. PP-CE-1G-424 TaxID=2135658 RepID=UPI001055738F|nr:GNAT family N-acetyltransferase [Sphingomonas sp. PP-CE-1G-424]TCP72502.1 CelD/BcsL family acetyltransferase involved in cellulose biosynthesis [Sphingomonas sp. PP-CE-1G-424]
MTPRIALKFQVGARPLATILRRLVRVAFSLDAVLAPAATGTGLVLPPLPDDADGYLVTSLPEPMLAGLDRRGLLAFVRQRYVRYHVDLAAGEAAWLAGLSGSARSGIKRKAKKLAAANGGALDIRRYHDAAAFADFHPLARAVSATTYQEKLLGSGLPDDAASVRHLESLAEQGRLRAWLMFIADTPAAYLCCTADCESLCYTHVGHDPAHNDLSPGAVLQVEAMRDLFAERRFARFDFTEGEGQHKRQFSTAGTACVDVLLLRPTLANRATVAALRGFDSAIASAKRAATHPALTRLAKKIRR